jgi:hypothetical protein
MPKKRFNAEQIVTLLRQVEVLMAQGRAAPEACREAGISQQNGAGRPLNAFGGSTVSRSVMPAGLSVRVARRINSFGVLETMADVMLMRGVSAAGTPDIRALSSPSR